MNFETYKGIEYIRISTLPADEQALIHKTLDETKIIKILRDNELITDCIQALHYREWKGVISQPREVPAADPLIKELKLAFK